MNPNDPTTDSLPTSRGTVIINTAVALFARTGEQNSAAKEGRARP
jgi:hypothetical protein